MPLITPYCVMSFPTLFTPKPRSEGGVAVYSAALIFDTAAQQTKEFKEMQAAVVKCAREKWGQQVKFDKLVLPFKDAEEKADKYDGYEPGFIFINAWSKQKPGIVDARLQDVLTPDEVYAGQIVRCQLSAFPWTNSGRSGVSFGLQNVQIVAKNAPRIDGRVAASKAFDAVSDISDASTDDEIPF